VLYLVNSTSLWRSSDGGATCAAQPSQVDDESLTVSPWDPFTVYDFGGQGARVSTDDGASFTCVTEGIP
jgi:photosystem II stability/assembly factor-like uncharacterized protein